MGMSPPVNLVTQKLLSMENHYFQWVNPLYMVIFNSYVKLPEGICGYTICEMTGKIRDLTEKSSVRLRLETILLDT